MKIQKITTEQLRHAVNLRDLSDPADGHHAMQIILQDILQALENAWGCQVIINREIPIVSIEDNYNRLHYPEDGAARDARYTRYVSDVSLLRTQTSSMIPRLLQKIASDLPEDVVLACPGLVYRRDCVDRIHCAEPHHLDLWRVKKQSSLGDQDLMGMIDTIMKAVLPGVEWKVSVSPHPYTKNGVEINALWGDEWLEVGECGLAHPDILAENLSQHSGMSGLAMGLGLDRILMVRKSINDIRLLRSTDQRIMVQMNDLSPYHEVSSMPPVARDLSLVLDSESKDEDIGDVVREALGANADIIELVETISETPYDDLPPAAKQRLGIRPGQKNILLRVVLRALDRSLTHEECNEYRDTIYAALHKGSEWQWASKRKVEYPS
ncbi:MAG: hypothetical protein DI626_08660 [Micavibrio aeruginosavorus]|uniref:FDX-ACB domain-containing protein n=1 Tax=Micavibrio aeruginosavorus TaxID=349221 RepID=A0A2W4ZTE5_9BACT|nr:MAG: hypothetical protein DI626_08660 [Micavibrio aeruginosavorus]